MALSQTKEQRKPSFAELASDSTDTVSGNDRVNNPSNADPSYATGLRLFMVMITINLSTMIASLDLGIVATAIPAITDTFHALNDIGWYGGACFILVGTSSAMWGKMFTYLPAQWVYIAGNLIYIIGSIIAAAAPSSAVLILGRAVQGFGCSGLLAGSAILINFLVHPKSRPMLLGLWMGMLMIATILGPLLGGVFTTKVTWRWCFWVNLPVCGVALALQLFYLRMPQHVKPISATWTEIFLHMDFPGFVLLVVSMVCYTLALQWGGLEKTWSGSVIMTLITFVALTVAFFVCEHIQGRYAMIPLQLFRPRKIWSQTILAWMLNGPGFQFVYYLPIYFQSVLGSSALTSGVYQLPYVASYALGCLISGAFVGATRHAQPIEMTGALLATLGAALVYQINENSSKAWYIGSQLPLGLGLGLGIQVPLIALQGFSDPALAGVMTGGLFVFQTMRGGYYITAAQSILGNRMLNHLAQVRPNISAQTALATGASEIRRKFTGEDLNAMRDAYMVGIKGIFAFILAKAVFSVLLTLLIPFQRLPKHETKKQSEEETTFEKEAAPDPVTS